MFRACLWWGIEQGAAFDVGEERQGGYTRFGECKQAGLGKKLTMGTPGI